ncbi:MAG: hypothetical protein U5R06_17770 [candidate division KSB1 bacterium]|nr:hypothetical protein [candidate division KSB1 bacterium]
MSAQTLAKHPGLERLAKSIRGYDGYHACDIREKTDTVVRAHLVNQIHSLLSNLGAEIQAQQEEDQRKIEQLVDKTKQKLTTICASLDDPTYTSGGFFGRDSVSERFLQRLYDLEADMLDETVNIDEEIASMKQEKMDKDRVEDHFLQINNYIDDFNQSLFEREALILGDE